MVRDTHSTDYRPRVIRRVRTTHRPLPIWLRPEAALRRQGSRQPVKCERARAWGTIPCVPCLDSCLRRNDRVVAVEPTVAGAGGHGYVCVAMPAVAPEHAYASVSMAPALDNVIHEIAAGVTRTGPRRRSGHRCQDAPDRFPHSASSSSSADTWDTGSSEPSRWFVPRPLRA
jgi:hypothetical protein